MINFQKKYTGNYLLCLFFDVSTSNALLLYTWILPVAKNKLSKQWVKIDGKGQYKNFLSIHACLSNEHVKEFFDLSAQGLSLEMVCQKMGFAKFQTSSKNSVVLEWAFPYDKYINRPAVIYKELPSFLEQKNYQFYSPTKEAIAEVESLFCLSKEEYLSRDNVLVACQFLKSKTGIEFTRSQFTRIGNIEWFELPCSDIQDSSLVRYHIKRNPLENNPEIISGNEVVVSLDETMSGDFFINVECLNANATILNELKTLSTDYSRSVHFFTNEAISRVKIKVWINADNCTKLIFQHSTWYIRSVQLSVNPVTGTATIETQRTFKLKKDVDINRRKEVESRESVSLNGRYPASVIKSESGDLWRDVIIDVNDFIQKDKRFLKKSDDALFLPRGWDGSVAFIDWYKKLGRKHDIGKIILIDPYADQEALLFLSRIGLSGIQFEILANSHLRPNPEQFREVLPNIFSGISKKLNMLSFKYYDASESKKLHDRYLIIQNKQGKLLSGYHLSNSIQGANSDFPLLITNIPLAVLYEVNDWLSEQLSDGYSANLLYDSSQENEKIKPKRIEINKNQFFLDEETIQNMAFADWEKICSSAHNNNETEQNLELAAARFSQQQWDDILNRVKQVVQKPITKENYRSEFSFYHIYDPKHSTSESYSKAMRHLKYDHFMAFEVSPEVFHFVKIALICAPNKLIELLDAATDNYSKDNLTGTVFAATIACLYWGNGNQHLVVQTKNEFIQGFICGQIFTKLMGQELKFDIAMKYISGLSSEQKLLILSLWIYEFRVSQNCNRSDNITTEISKKIFEQMIGLWFIDLSDETLDAVFKACCGPSLGDHADSTTNELFIPLISENKLKIERLWLYLIKLFKEKIMDEHPYSKSNTPVFSSVGYLSQLIDTKSRESNIKWLKKIISEKKRILNQPFINSIDYECFSVSNTILHNILLALKHMESSAPDVNEYGELIQELEDYLKDRNVYLNLSNHDLVQHIQLF